MSLLLKFFFDRLRERSSDSDSESITQTSSPPVDATFDGFIGAVLDWVLLFGWVLFVSATFGRVLAELATVGGFEDVSFGLFWVAAAPEKNFRISCNQKELHNQVVLIPKRLKQI